MIFSQNFLSFTGQFNLYVMASMRPFFTGLGYSLDTGLDVMSYLNDAGHSICYVVADEAKYWVTK